METESEWRRNCKTSMLRSKLLVRSNCLGLATKKKHLYWPQTAWQGWSSPLRCSRTWYWQWQSSIRCQTTTQKRKTGSKEAEWRQKTEGRNPWIPAGSGAEEHVGQKTSQRSDTFPAGNSGFTRLLCNTCIHKNKVAGVVKLKNACSLGVKPLQSSAFDPSEEAKFSKCLVWAHSKYNHSMLQCQGNKTESSKTTTVSTHLFLEVSLEFLDTVAPISSCFLTDQLDVQERRLGGTKDRSRCCATHNARWDIGYQVLQCKSIHRRTTGLTQQDNGADPVQQLHVSTATIHSSQK